MRRRAFFFALPTTITVSGCTQNGSTSNTSTTSEPKTPNTKKKGEVAIWNKRETEVSVALSVGSSSKNLQLNPDSVWTSEDMIDDGEYTTISVRTSDGLAQRAVVNRQT